MSGGEAVTRHLGFLAPVAGTRLDQARAEHKAAMADLRAGLYLNAAAHCRKALQWLDVPRSGMQRDMKRNIEATLARAQAGGVQ